MKKRKHRMIAFKAYTDADADLLAWWQSIPTGARSGALREMLRLALGYRADMPDPEADMAALRADVSWIRGVLLDLPVHMSAMAQQMPTGLTAPNGSDATLLTMPEMSDRSAQLREQRLRKPKW